MNDISKDPDEDDIQDYLDLERFVGPNEAAAQTAFTALWRRRDRALRGYLRARGVDARDRQDDILQDAVHRIWTYRSRYTNKGPHAWRSFAYRTVKNCYFDVLRQLKSQPTFDLDDARTELEEEFSALLLAASEGAWFFRQADILWLGLDSAQPELHDRQILAGLLFYVDNWTWSEILDHLNESTPTARRVCRSDLDRWLASPGVVRGVAYYELYLTNVELASLLLGVSSNASGLDALLARSPLAPCCTSSWTEQEVRAILWRFYRILLFEEIVAQSDITLDPQQWDPLESTCRHASLSIL